MRAARRLAADALEASRYPGDVETVLLLVSELVTNAVRHAATEFELHLHIDELGVTVAVVDHDRTHPPRLQHPGPTDTHGRGLQIVDQLASDWGSEPVGPDAKQVWFCCRAAAASTAPPVSAPRERPGRPAPAVPAGPRSASRPRR